MTEYRITKYDPQNRMDDVYLVHEWTSISDIGKIFDSGVLSYAQYKKVEQAYIDCCIELVQHAGILEFSVCCPEYYDMSIQFPQVVSSETDIRHIIMCCLQEKCWLKLESEAFYIHFGYDYYMYIGTNLPCTLVEEVSQNYKLFCEKIPSPYRNYN